MRSPARSPRRDWFERLLGSVRDGARHYYLCSMCHNEETCYSRGPERVLCAICGEEMDCVGVKRRRR